MSATFNSLHAAAWSKVGIGTREKPAEVFPKFTKRDFEDLKTDYNNLYGYTIRVPQWDDVIHLVPTALKSKEVIKAEKKEGLVRLLESPMPNWAKNYSTAMTWIDNIQDTASVVYPLIKLLTRIAPKAMTKVMGLIGWLTAGYDILNILNAIGRAPLTGMKSKRELCKYYRQNPFSKQARYERISRIKNWKPNIADAIQAAQVSDQFLGVGLSLGSMMGMITDSIFGAYRYVTGEPVRWTFDPPEITTLDMVGARGLKAAAAISSQGQTFSDFIHFWTYITGALSTIAFSGTFKTEGLTDLVENPMEMMLPAPEPTDPLTISVIEEMGLSVQDGIGWPYNGKKFISASDYIDATIEPCRANFVEYCNRHSKDSYGFLAAMALDYLTPAVILSIDPDAIYHVDDTDEMKIFWKMLKAPLVPTGSVSKDQSDAFWSWANGYKDLYGDVPGIMAIEEKFNLLGIKFLISYPTTPGPDFERFWPKGWSGEESF